MSIGLRRHRPTAARTLLAAAVLSLIAEGCGPQAPRAESSLTEATVTGRVTADGKPVTKGRVVFDPSNVNRRMEPARMAEIRADGTYEVKTLIGANRVTVAIPGRTRKGGAPDVQEVYDVRTGSNSFDLKLP